MNAIENGFVALAFILNRSSEPQACLDGTVTACKTVTLFFQQAFEIRNTGIILYCIVLFSAGHLSGQVDAIL
jgi:hypothetical protein